MIIIGTCHFTDISAAIAYFRPYGYSAANVREKLHTGDIALGPPSTLKRGQRWHINSERRYVIVEGEAS